MLEKFSIKSREDFHKLLFYIMPLVYGLTVAIRLIIVLGISDSTMMAFTFFLGICGGYLVKWIMFKIARWINRLKM